MAKNRLIHMNKGNLRKHAVSKARKALNCPTKENLDYAVDLMFMVDNNGAKCDVCPQDDFGYCGLRREFISWDELRQKYCLPAFIKAFSER